MITSAPLHLVLCMQSSIQCKTNSTISSYGTHAWSKIWGKWHGTPEEAALWQAELLSFKTPLLSDTNHWEHLLVVMLLQVVWKHSLWKSQLHKLKSPLVCKWHSLQLQMRSLLMSLHTQTHTHACKHNLERWVEVNETCLHLDLSQVHPLLLMVLNVKLSPDCGTHWHSSGDLVISQQWHIHTQICYHVSIKASNS